MTQLDFWREEFQGVVLITISEVELEVGVLEVFRGRASFQPYFNNRFFNKTKKNFNNFQGNTNAAPTPMRGSWGQTKSMNQQQSKLMSINTQQKKSPENTKKIIEVLQEIVVDLIKIVQLLKRERNI